MWIIWITCWTYLFSNIYFYILHCCWFICYSRGSISGYRGSILYTLHSNLEVSLFMFWIFFRFSPPTSSSWKTYEMRLHAFNLYLIFYLFFYILFSFFFFPFFLLYSSLLCFFVYLPVSLLLGCARFEMEYMRLLNVSVKLSFELGYWNQQILGLSRLMHKDGWKPNALEF